MKMADDFIFDFLHMEIVDYVQRSACKDEKVSSLSHETFPIKLKSIINFVNWALLIVLVLSIVPHIVNCVVKNS